MNEQTIIFVYNAESGVGNAVKDFFHKSLRPETYACNLCALTYPVAWKDPRWKEFLQSLPIEVEFEYRDTLEEKYQLTNVPLPAVFLKNTDNALSIWIDAETINQLQTLDQLMAAVQERLAQVILSPA